jgi:hypothetical protein
MPVVVELDETVGVVPGRLPTGKTRAFITRATDDNHNNMLQVRINLRASYTVQDRNKSIHVFLIIIMHFHV